MELKALIQTKSKKYKPMSTEEQDRIELNSKMQRDMENLRFKQECRIKALIASTTMCKSDEKQLEVAEEVYQWLISDQINQTTILPVLYPSRLSNERRHIIMESLKIIQTKLEAHHPKSIEIKIEFHDGLEINENKFSFLDTI